ncbi:MAG: hypothetical protein VKJ46_13325 [Leptolyngbyaceae bacterium]|nr:hypothetical protein [Leptolyngbyaceae bacterium]
MKQNLRRIEAALDQIEGQPRIPVRWSRSSTSQSYSFTLHKEPSPEKPRQRSDIFLAPAISVQAVPVPRASAKNPTLPKLNPPKVRLQPSLQSPRPAPQTAPPQTQSFNAAKPSRSQTNTKRVLDLLREVEATVLGWHEELNQVLQRIQFLYREGPMVDGWLETASQSVPSRASQLHQVEVSDLMNYVEEIWEPSHATSASPTPRSGYRLCGVDEAGQFWSRSCPPEQVASVRIAIARYQKLQRLLEHKKALETRLNQLAETLLVLQKHL